MTVFDWALHPRRRWKQWRHYVAMVEEAEKYARPRDPDENAESTPPASEEIRLRAVWVAESYPLSFLETLLDAVKRLTAQGHHHGQPPADRIEEALRLGNAGWFPLGPVVDPGSTSFAYLSPIRTALPTDVEYAFAAVHYLVPSHAVLVLAFVLNDSGSRLIEQTLRATYQSYAAGRGTWVAVQGPANQKRSAVRARRAEKLAELGAFFEREAPGLFASDQRQLPSIEFWTTKERTPFNDGERRSGRASINDFIQVLGWIAWSNTWLGPASLTLKEAPLTGDMSWGRGPNLQLVGREDDLFADEDLEMYGGRSREGYVNRLKESVESLAAVLALTETFRYYEAEQIASRRRLREAQSRSLRRRVKATAGVQQRLLRQHGDVEAAARGVTRFKDDLAQLFKWQAIDFERWQPPPVGDRLASRDPTARSKRWLKRLILIKGERKPLTEHPPPPRESWLEEQANEILVRADNAVAGSREIGDVVGALSVTTSAQANLRLQLHLTILTWLLAGIGIATLVVVIVTAN